MDKEERKMCEWWTVISFIVLLFMLVACLMSCGTVKYVPVETVMVEYKTRDSIRVDSVYNRDSIYIERRGDTVTEYRYKYLYKYLFLNRTDTVIKTDSVQVPYPVEKKLTKWQKAKIELGGWAFGVIIVFGMVIVRWLVLKRRNK